MVLTADLHATKGWVCGWFVTLGEGGGSRSSAHSEAVSTASTSASAPSPPPLHHSRKMNSSPPFSSSASNRLELELGRPVLPAALFSSSPCPELTLVFVVVVGVVVFVINTTSYINDRRDYHIARECALRALFLFFTFFTPLSWFLFRVMPQHTFYR